MQINRDIAATIKKKEVTFKFNGYTFKISKEELQDLATKLIKFPEGFKPVTSKINIKKIEPGTWYLESNVSTPILGKIQIENNELFLCQNRNNGKDCKNKWGYKYSWTLGDWDWVKDDFVDSIFAIAPPSTKVNPEIICEIKKFGTTRGVDCFFGNETYDISIRHGHISVGCQLIHNNIVRKLVKEMSKIKPVKKI